MYEMLIPKNANAQDIAERLHYRRPVIFFLSIILSKYFYFNVQF